MSAATVAAPKFSSSVMPAVRPELAKTGVSHLRSEAKQVARPIARAAVRRALSVERATNGDIAEALDVSYGNATRAVEGSTALDLEVIVALAKKGIRERRIARRILAELRDAIDRIELEEPVSSAA